MSRTPVPPLEIDERSLLAELALEHRLWRPDAHPVVLARGAENTTFMIGDWIVRRGREPAAVAREVRLLRALAEMTTVPLPRPRLHEPGSGVLAYRRLPGTPLLRRAGRRSASVERGLVETLGALRVLDPAVALPVDRCPPAQWHRDAARQFGAIASHLEVEVARAVEAFLAQPPPSAREETVPQHDDLGAEHLLVDRHGRLTGIIDWSDAARTDASHDLGSLLRDLGPDAARRIAGELGLGADEEEHTRVLFHARCRWVEDVAYALADPLTRGAYLANVRRTAAHVFATQRPRGVAFCG